MPGDLTQRDHDPSVVVNPIMSCLSLFSGPNRALFLPGGLLEISDLPEYLDGSLPGE